MRHCQFYLSMENRAHYLREKMCVCVCVCLKDATLRNIASKHSVSAFVPSKEMIFQPPYELTSCEYRFYIFCMQYQDVWTFKHRSMPFANCAMMNWSSVEGKTESSRKLLSLLRPLVVDTSSCFFFGTTQRWPTHIVSSHSFKRCCVWELFLILFWRCWGRKYPQIWSFISFCTGIWGGVRIFLVNVDDIIWYLGSQVSRPWKFIYC